MNFFEHQRRAKQKTKFLVFLFAVGVLGLVLLTNLVAWAVMEFIGFAQTQDRNPIYAFATLATFAVIWVSALYKKHQLGQHGSGIAEYMGGTEAQSIRHELGVQQALNCVEEMAIAAGTTPPPLYILTQEKAINAFAAGLTPQTSVIAISQGCLDHLTRDELQGVIAHEMSHIYNGDTRLNVQLLGYLAGIVTIGVMGQLVVQTMTRGRVRTRGGKNGGSGLALVLFVGVSLWVIGSVGLFVGRMIRAAVSRQREFLADASAAQFTRHPAGIAGALAKIAQHTGRLSLAGAEEVSHMCFESPLRFHFFSLFATHPPLTERIRRLDASFLNFKRRQGSIPNSPDGANRVRRTPKSLLNTIGEPSAENLAFVQSAVMSKLPVFRSDCDETLQAQAIVLGLLSLETEPELSLKNVRTYCTPDLFKEYRTKRDSILSVSRELVLPTLHHCIPKLRSLSKISRKVFLRTCQFLIEADQEINLSEVSLFLILELHLGDSKDWILSDMQRLSTSGRSVSLILSLILLHGHSNLGEADLIYQKAVKPMALSEPFQTQAKKIDLDSLRIALRQLAELNPSDKEMVIKAILECAQADDEIRDREFHFIQATCEYLGVPLPL